MKDYPVLDKKKCISCYVCHENCPEGAIYLKRPFIIEIGAKAYKLVTKTASRFKK